MSNDFLFTAHKTIDLGVACDPINDYNDHCTMNKVLEYMAFGKPQVMFDLREGRESAGDAAWYVPENSAASHLFVARMLLHQGYDTIAEVQARKATDLDSRLPLAHYLLGDLYIFKSRIPEAIRDEFAMAVHAGLRPGYRYHAFYIGGRPMLSVQ